MTISRPDLGVLRRESAFSTRAAANASAALAAVIFGASVVAVKVAVRDVPPLTLALLRFAQGALVLGAVLAVFRRDLLRVERRDLPFLALLGALLFAIFPVTFNLGLRYDQASRAALIMATMPLLTILIGRLASHERLNTRQVIGVLTSVAGVAIVMADRGGASGALRGDLLLLGTALCGAIYNVLVKRVLGRYTGITVTLYAMIFGSLFLAPASIIEGGMPLSSLTGQLVALIFFLGAFGGALAFSLWTAALRRLSPTQVAVYINLNPVSATLLATLTLREKLSGSFVVGFIAVAAGVVTVNWRGEKAKPQMPDGAESLTARNH